MLVVVNGVWLSGCVCVWCEEGRRGEKGEKKNNITAATEMATLKVVEKKKCRSKMHMEQMKEWSFCWGVCVCACACASACLITMHKYDANMM